MSNFVNQFQVYAYGDMFRIIFEDCVTGKEGVIQGNYVLRTADAEQLAAVILTTIKQNREQNRGPKN